MAIFLKNQKKLKRGNSLHKKPPPIPGSNFRVVSFRAATQCKTRVELPETKTAVKGKKKKNHRCKNLRFFLPKRINDIISNACGGSRKAIKEECTFGSACEWMEKRDTFDKPHSIFEIRVGEDDRRGRQEIDGSNCKKSSISRFFSKRNGFNFKRFGIGYNSTSNGSEKVSGDKLMIEKDMKLGEMMMYQEKKDIENEDSKELELCKKRILMGGKCRPLNRSGILHYDKEGILLPEDAIQCEE